MMRKSLKHNANRNYLHLEFGNAILLSITKVLTIRVNIWRYLF